MADEWAIALQEAKRQAPEIWIQERGFREGWDALARRIVVSDDRSVVCWQGVNYIAQPLVESAREERVTLEQHGRVIEAMADMEQRAHAAEAEVEHLRTGLRERGFIVGRNPDGVDDTVASALLIVDDFKAANGRLREALTAVAGYKHAPLIESLDDARRVAAAALSPREDA